MKFHIGKTAMLATVLLLGLSLLNCSNQSTDKQENEKQDPQKQEAELTAQANVTRAVIETNMGNIELELWPDIAPKTVENFVKLGSSDFYNRTYFHRVIPDFMIQGGDPNTKDADRSNDGQGGPGYRFEDECYDRVQATGNVADSEVAAAVWTDILIPYMQSAQNPQAEIFEIVKKVQESQSYNPIFGKTVEFYQDRTGITGPLYRKVLKAKVLYGYICMANSGPNADSSQFFIVTKKDGTPWLDGKHTVFGKVVAGMDIVHKIENLPRDRSDNPLLENQAVVNAVSFPK